MPAQRRMPQRANAPSRRRFLTLTGAAAIALGCGPGRLLAAARGPRHIAFRHLHTGESLAVTYWEQGAYVASALAGIDHLLRDFRTGDQHHIDPALLDILHLLRSGFGSDAPYEIISGYRSPHTNEMLRQRGGGVARRSLHMEGRAIDVRLAGGRTRDLRRAAIALGAGGVGYYPKSDFVHLDTGRVRSWG